MMKMIMRSLVFLIGIALILLDISPYIISSEINIGLIAGIAAGFVLIIYGIFFHPVNAFVAKVFSHTAGKVILSFVAVVSAFAVAIGGFTLAKVIAYSCESDKKTEYIIVLGCKVNSVTPGRFLTARLNKAYEYLTETPGSKAILSGGQGDGEDISEARCMFNYLTYRGIDPGRLILEESSTSTIENFENSLRIFESEGVSIDEITVVTHDFHEYRASRFALKSGLKAYSYPAKTPWNGYLPFAIREVFAVVYQVYLGRNELRN